ncbi:haloacid dehalogenase-like hydrolase domain-containing protein 2 [Ctenocephalides felis]|uniref:haloacid dehalogenase-like hydrolase domain-containing protein 2 n=1 Tax=Ctenocephalides felis TaxID=7515 RepID=UPI000E6E3D16|nr:haloacid dehalogenase-like hydrolase domain-containing protein 2 [Ctenocephalides felis]
MNMKIKAALIDLSGTLHIGNSIIPNSINALNELQSSGCLVRFVTNTTKESSKALHGRLQKLGFPIKKEEIFTTLTAANNIITDRKLKPLMLVAEEALEDFTCNENQNSEEFDSVVIGLAPSELHYEKLNAAFRILTKGGQLIALNTGKYYMREDGLAIGAGFFVKGLEYSAQTKAEVVGKPNASFFKSAVLGHNVTCEETVMIGDDVTDDIEGALKIGMKAVLVKTGKYRPDDELKILPLKPTAVVDSFPEAVKFIQSLL